MKEKGCLHSQISFSSCVNAIFSEFGFVFSHGEYVFFVKQSQDLQKWRRGHIFQKVLLFRIHIHFCTCMLVISYLRRIFQYVICKYRIIIIIICACTWFYCLIILSIPIEPLSYYIYIISRNTNTQILHP
jgi:hypothetical protein